MNFCKDCVHFELRTVRDPSDTYRTFQKTMCNFLKGKTHPVTGQEIVDGADASGIRLSSVCGWSGSEFKAKEPI